MRKIFFSFLSVRLPVRRAKSKREIMEKLE
jgi:hypothetical protein